MTSEADRNDRGGGNGGGGDGKGDSAQQQQQQPSSTSAGRQGGTRVFKKSSPNGKITAYLGKRDFVDHIAHTDPIDGLVLIDKEYCDSAFGKKKIMASLTCAFRYGREDLDVLGLTFRKELHQEKQQVYPPTEANADKLCTRLQERLLRKLGENAYPFFFKLPPQSPCSVTLQPAPGDTGKPCGVDYELKAYVLEEGETEPNRKNNVRLVIRKVQFAPDRQAPQPTSEVQQDFILSNNPITLEATLDKELYYHGETLNVNVQITNNSNRAVRKIKISVRQFADICLYSSAQYKCQVASVEQDTHVPPSSTLCRVFQITPSLGDNRDKRGLALDGQLKHEDTNLASTTLSKDGVPRENLGIVVSYKVKVKLIMNGFGGDVSLCLPFSLMHSKPDDDRDNQRPKNAQNARAIRQELGSRTNLQTTATADGTNENMYSREPTGMTTLDSTAPDQQSVNLICFDEGATSPQSTGFNPFERDINQLQEEPTTAAAASTPAGETVLPPDDEFGDFARSRMQQ